MRAQNIFRLALLSVSCTIANALPAFENGTHLDIQQSTDRLVFAHFMVRVHRLLDATWRLSYLLFWIDWNHQ
jgi:hypothetical protein